MKNKLMKIRIVVITWITSVMWSGPIGFSNFQAKDYHKVGTREKKGFQCEEYREGILHVKPIISYRR
jgi:hypothetical protein